jgi:hypothetical protein
MNLRSEEEIMKLNFSSWTRIALIATLLQSVHPNFANSAPAHDPQTSVSPDPDTENKGGPGPADAFSGNGGHIDNTGVVSPGQLEFNLFLARSSGSGRPVDLTAMAEVNYGIEFYKDLQIGCAMPYVTEKSQNENGEYDRTSGYGTPECHVKVLFYENDQTGVSASSQISLQKAQAFAGRNFPGNDPYNHLVGSLVVQKDLKDGKISLVGSASLDRTLHAGPEIEHPNQVTLGAGAGYRINRDSSIAVDATKTILGVAWVDLTYFHRLPILKKMTNNQIFGYIDLGRSSSGSYADSNQKVITVGVQINPRQKMGPRGGIFHEIVEAQENAKAAKDSYAKDAASAVDQK